MCMPVPTTPPRSGSIGSERASAVRRSFVAILPEFTSMRDLRDYLSGWRDHEICRPREFADRVARQRVAIQRARRIR
jgi:hypothetical protein